MFDYKSLLLISCVLFAVNAYGKVSEQESKKLGSVLTPMGADPAANDAGTIPSWSGQLSKSPTGNFRSGDVYFDPYANEQPLHVIDAENMVQYAENLSDGQKALLKKYPESFRIPVYPTHRDGRPSKKIQNRTQWNATRTELVNGIDGLRNYTGGVPFPVPKQAAEVMWNGRAAHFNPTVNATYDDIATYSNGRQQLRRQHWIGDFPYALEKNEVGSIDEEIGVYGSTIMVKTLLPVREKGKMLVVHEPMDQLTYERNAWIYMPGTRRVRRAPTVGYDTPDGPGGLITIDDNMGHTGAMDRYEFEFVGKREVYIPYHNYRFDSPDIQYKSLLPPRHANPDYMRYELHRVWIVEAHLKSGTRHIYAKRRWYIDEDSWQIALLESYDGRGQLWRVGILNTLYDYALQSYVDRVQMFHDLLSNAYVAIRLVNETEPAILTKPPMGQKFFSPQNLRKIAKR